jgi:hypothetical protein
VIWPTCRWNASELLQIFANVNTVFLAGSCGEQQCNERPSKRSNEQKHAIGVWDGTDKRPVGLLSVASPKLVDLGLPRLKLSQEIASINTGRSPFVVLVRTAVLCADVMVGKDDPKAN